RTNWTAADIIDAYVEKFPDAPELQRAGKDREKQYDEQQARELRESKFDRRSWRPWEEPPIAVTLTKDTDESGYPTLVLLVSNTGKKPLLHVELSAKINGEVHTVLFADKLAPSEPVKKPVYKIGKELGDPGALRRYLRFTCLGY